ncbi:MAG: VWA domain-containing protein [Flavobacteriales bacterium]|jgi:Ca-activated chloride channel family protein|tara:strand:+ start:5597 stop:6592 length:996 start_codon:yes stop_codon:yes gene_type:complete
MNFNNWTFANPEFLFLLAIIPLLWVWRYFYSKRQFSSLKISSIQSFKTKSWKENGKFIIFLLRTLALCFIIIGFARPQSSSSWQDSTTMGIDIIISMDISGSMLAQDLKPDRLEASKNVALDFISARPNDRMGLVIFSGESFTQCPLTTDHQVLQNLFKDVKSGMIEDGTAIGMGLATSVNRLKDSQAISKVVILLTDGVNNKGSIPPLTAAKIAQKFGIRVYTIGVGTEGFAPYPFKTPFGTTVYQDVEVQIDEKTLQDIATTTNGKYFRATSNKALKEIYLEIDELERSKIDVKEFSKKNEEFRLLILIALSLLLIEFYCKKFLFKSIT